MRSRRKENEANRNDSDNVAVNLEGKPVGGAGEPIKDSNNDGKIDGHDEGAIHTEETINSNEYHLIPGRTYVKDRAMTIQVEGHAVQAAGFETADAESCGFPSAEHNTPRNLRGGT